MEKKDNILYPKFIKRHSKNCKPHEDELIHEPYRGFDVLPGGIPSREPEQDGE